MCTSYQALQLVPSLLLSITPKIDRGHLAVRAFFSLSLLLFLTASKATECVCALFVMLRYLYYFFNLSFSPFTHSNRKDSPSLRLQHHTICRAVGTDLDKDLHWLRYKSVHMQLTSGQKKIGGKTLHSPYSYFPVALPAEGGIGLSGELSFWNHTWYMEHDEGKSSIKERARGSS